MASLEAIRRRFRSVRVGEAEMMLLKCWIFPEVSGSF